MTDWPLVPPGVWLTLDRQAFETRRPALFLDRDGVIVEESGFLSDPGGVHLVDGIADLIRTANHSGIPVAVVTNQSGIARGLFGWNEFAAVQTEIARRLAADRARLDAVSACPFHPDFTPGYGQAHESFRKPGPGMLELIGTRLNLDLRASWLVGDQARDIEAARRAGLAGGIWLRRSEPAQARSDPSDRQNGFRTLICADNQEAEAALRAALLDRA